MLTSSFLGFESLVRAKTLFAETLCTPAVYVLLVPVLTALFKWMSSTSTEKESSRLPTHITGNLSYISLVKYIQAPDRFIQHGFRQTKEHIWRFTHQSKTIIVLSGHTAREALFKARDFDLKRGVQLISFLPPIPGISVDVEAEDYLTILRRVANIQRTENLDNVILPNTVADCCRVMGEWGKSGNINPFKAIRELTFYLNLRSLTCEDVANDYATAKKLNSLYDKLDFPLTIEGQVFPWLPTWNNMKRIWHAKTVHDIFMKAITDRKVLGTHKDDTLQMLIDNGDEKTILIGVLMGMMLAGSKAMGRVGNWVISYIASEPEWRQKIFDELNTLVELNSGEPISPSQPLGPQIAKISVEEWESRTPVLDSIVYETLRIAQPQSAMRRNCGDDMYIDGKLVPKDSYVIYAYSDIHLNPEIYPEPWEFIPGRPVPQDVPFANLAWGGGTTKCAGMRVAKLQLKIAAAIFVMGFDSSIVDRDGVPRKIPRPNWNDLTGGPMEEFLVKFSRTEYTL